jgi:Trehalase-like, N-terminal
MRSPHALRDYALLADGERGAIVGPRGEIVWMCAPRWDSDAVFASLIGGEGSYAVTPAARFVWGGYYEQGTLIWRSRWVTDEGVIECREALALPGDPHRVVLLRSIMPGDAPAMLRVSLDARAGFSCGCHSTLVLSPALRPARRRWAASSRPGWRGPGDRPGSQCRRHQLGLPEAHPHADGGPVPPRAQLDEIAELIDDP